jgi:hypothetical protein
MSSSGLQAVAVGVSHGPGSRAALAFAMREAAVRGSPLQVITVWTGPDDDVRDGHQPARSRWGAQRIQDSAVAQTLQAVESRPVLSRLVIEGDAGRMLLRLAQDAAFLVVGSEGEPARTGSSLSVGAYCLRNATGAVVVVPAPASNADSADGTA